MSAGKLSLSRRSGLTLLELAIVTAIVGLAGSILVAGLLKAREKSRRSICESNQAKIMRGVLEYESNRGQFPPGRLFPDWVDSNGSIRGGYTNYSGVSQTEHEKTGFYSVHVWILPYLGAQDVFAQIDFDRAQAKRMESGGTPYNINYAAYTQPMPLFLCPSDPNTGRGITENNYRCNFGGDTPGAGVRPSSFAPLNPRPTDAWHIGGNGAFTIGETGLELQAFEDGLTQTVFFSERIKGSGNDTTQELPRRAAMIRSPRQVSPALPVSIMFDGCLEYESQPSVFVNNSAGRWLEGSDWSNGWPFAGYDSTQYNHVAPPNWEGFDCGVSFIPDTPAEHAIVAARSAHPKSVYVAFGDGHTKRVMDDIDLTVWRALGTRNGGELTEPLPRPSYRPGRRSPWRPPSQNR